MSHAIPLEDALEDERHGADDDRRQLAVLEQPLERVIDHLAVHHVDLRARAIGHHQAKVDVHRVLDSWQLELDDLMTR